MSFFKLGSFLRLSVMFGTTLVCCLLTGLLLFFVGFQSVQEWNDNTKETTCTVKETKTVQTSCYEYYCGIGACYRNCWKEAIIVTYIPSDGVSRDHEFKVGESNTDEFSAEYGVGEQISCYYEKDDLDSVHLELKDGSVFLGLSITFFALTGICMAISGLKLAAVEKAVQTTSFVEISTSQIKTLHFYSNTMSDSERDESLCNICGTELDEDEQKETDIMLAEWLTISRDCRKCRRTGCRECMGTCYTCANEGDFDGEYCKDCVQFDYVDCRYHTWLLCKKHKDDECGECRANRNYCLRHQ
jgi:hypothetical protein